MSGTFVGMPAFPAAAREAVRDTTLRGNLRHATHTIRAKRARAVAELDDWERLRQAGKRIKDRTLRHLDRCLVQLEESVTAAGGVVHWAADADEANRIVAELVKATGETEVVKVKSMATQEIALNEALEAQGIHAYETDLAELIVQLGKDRPSHILVPAIHRNRGEIRDIFTREMGEWGRPAPEGLTDTPADLAEAARLHLREKFLRAKVGISGANFMVAETGTLVVVESEGNGRMCLTLPETLISVVGIEKIVPTWQDLEVFLQTLPRSSTAERMNPYTSMWTGTTDGDGPRDFHLVLLDNGRTDTLADEVGPAGAALHPLLRLPERLPGVRAAAWARVRVGVPGSDRRHPQPSTPRHGKRDRRVAAVRLVAVRGLLRGVPGRHRHPRGAGASAGAGGGGRRGRPGGQQGAAASGEGARGRAGGDAGGPLGAHPARCPAHRSAARLAHAAAASAHAAGARPGVERDA